MIFRNYSLIVEMLTLALAGIPAALAFVHSSAQWNSATFQRRNSVGLFVSSRTNVDNNWIASDQASDSNKDLTYLRWNKEGDSWKIQTAVTTFQRGQTTVELHAQLHFADAEYFNFYNSPDFSESLDHVHYELLVDQDLLEYDIQSATKQWRLKAPIMASINDRKLANSYGWTCQASQIDYRQRNWIHADMTRQEFLEAAQSKPSEGFSEPLWKLASVDSQSSSTAAEAVSALFIGPPQLSYSQSLFKRRLFTNLFLPGSKLANALRAILWMTVPAPELSVILLDWSSILSGNAQSSRTAQVNPSALSDVAWPILSSMAKFDIHSIRRFLFGQVLVTANNINRGADQDQAWSLLVTKRNDRAMDVLRSTLTSKPDDQVRSALLYGGGHCPDLHRKLVADGFTPVKTAWRTAWSVQEQSSNVATIVPVLTFLLLGYLSIGALDWVGMLSEVSKVWEVEQDHHFDAGIAAFFYLVRHVLLYLGLSKFLVDWTSCKD